MTAQAGSAVILCVECKKPRVIYSRKQLTNNQRYLLAKTMSSYEYSFPPTEKEKTAQTLRIQPHLQCAMQIEVIYYGLDVGRADKCSHCGGNNYNVSVDAILKGKFQTVLPICNPCLAEGKEPQKHFGK